jgi:hypothetical protein
MLRLVAISNQLLWYYIAEPPETIEPIGTSWSPEEKPSNELSKK